MRTLIYVPVIHTSADLGSLAGDVTKRGIADLGEDVWREHQKTVEGLWDAVSDYFDSIDVSGMKIYQDGMVAEGEIGEKIVEEGLNLGSRNYELIAKLLKRGAALVKTEDFNLVKKERDKLLKITQAKTRLEKLFGFIRYKLTKNILLNKRDRFIAQRIEETIKEGGSGILFIGAYHNILDKLPQDIKAIEIKNREKVLNYMKGYFLKSKRDGIGKLAEYLRKPVSIEELKR